MDWFLYDKELCHKRVKCYLKEGLFQRHDSKKALVRALYADPVLGIGNLIKSSEFA